MKLMTLNTHSLAESDYESKLHVFTNTVLSEKPDIIALQEVNQSMNAKPARNPERFINSGKIPLKSDNHALKVHEIIKDGGLDYHFCWAGIKCGYGKYDEGLATFSLRNIDSSEVICLSETDDYNSWKTRKCLITSHRNFMVCNTHMGWWDDKDKPFEAQWNLLDQKLKTCSQPVFLMGDFNSPSHIKNQGYDLIKSSGWFDTYCLSDTKDEGFTVSGIPDGWNRKIESRIDYIFTNTKTKVISSRTMFKEHPVSDHYGIMITI